MLNSYYTTDHELDELVYFFTLVIEILVFDLYHVHFTLFPHPFPLTLWALCMQLWVPISKKKKKNLHKFVENRGKFKIKSKLKYNLLKYCQLATLNEDESAPP